MRRRVLAAILLGWVICLTLAVLPLQAGTRYVGLGGLVMFSLMAVGEHRRPRPPTDRLPILVHGSHRG